MLWSLSATRSKAYLAIVLLALFVGAAAPADSQEASVPLLLIEGNRYDRATFAEDGRLEESQRLEIGRVVQTDDELGIAVTMCQPNQSGVPTDTTRH